jgi:hypothetical protein
MAGWEPLDIGILLVRRRDKLLDDLSKGASQNQGRKRKPGDETKAA